MSAYHNDDVANFLQTTGLSIPANQTVLLCYWTKRSNVSPTTSAAACELGISTVINTPPYIIQFQSQSARTTQVNGDTFTEETNLGTILDTWIHRALWVGPLDGVANRPVDVYTNGGARRAWTTITYDATGVNFTHFTLFRRVGSAASNPWRGRLAEFGIWSNITTTQRDTIIDEAQTKHVGAISIAPSNAWRLLTDSTAAAGGVGLNATGTITYDATDHPPVGAGVAARRRVVWVD